MNHRLTRQEIKRDEVMEGLSRAVEFLRRHGRALGIGLLAVVVVIAGLAIWRVVSAGREERANLALAEALSGVTAADGELGAAREALEGVAERYGSTGPGAVAAAYLGTIAAREADYETARSYWERLLDRRADDALAAGVERNLISLDRAEGRNDALAERLRAALAAGTSALGEDALLFELGRTLEDLGQVEGANEIYGRLLEEHPTSLFAAAARERTSALAES
ncbi:MAG: tetratricopeptide repeat protein [Acidobacteriota bacterium]|nr:tetratricopeptide repeat protein [Acidobacteriota bacterium]